VSAGDQDRVNRALGLLRDTRAEGRVDAGLAPLPGLRLSIDPAARPRGRWRSPPGTLIELDIEVTTAPAATRLHIDLGSFALAPGSLFGLACRTSAGGLDLVRPLLRSGTEGGPVDHPFPRHLLSRPEPALHLDAIDIDADGVPTGETRREIVLDLPTYRLFWRLDDLRVFLA